MFSDRSQLRKTGFLWSLIKIGFSRSLFIEVRFSGIRGHKYLMKLAETPSKYKKNEDVFSRRAPQSVETKDKLALANVAYNYNIGSFYPWNAFVVSQKHTVKWLENCYREPIGSFKFENTFEVVFNFGIWIQNELKNTSRRQVFFVNTSFLKGLSCSLFTAYHDQEWNSYIPFWPICPLLCLICLLLRAFFKQAYLTNRRSSLI